MTRLKMTYLLAAVTTAAFAGLAGFLLQQVPADGAVIAQHVPGTPVFVQLLLIAALAFCALAGWLELSTSRSVERHRSVIPGHFVGQGAKYAAAGTAIALATSAILQSGVFAAFLAPELSVVAHALCLLAGAILPGIFAVCALYCLSLAGSYKALHWY
jgi:hypothetical protein